MATRRIREERVRDLNEGAVRDGDYVLYWMQSSQRAEQNHALEYAVRRANDLGQRLLVVFGLTEGSDTNLTNPRLAFRAHLTPDGEATLEVRV